LCVLYGFYGATMGLPQSQFHSCFINTSIQHTKTQ